jgi:hypothetical protein
MVQHRETCGAGDLLGRIVQVGRVAVVDLDSVTRPDENDVADHLPPLVASAHLMSLAHVQQPTSVHKLRKPCPSTGDTHAHVKEG